ncbi:MAG: hypothetical protein Harvfovirus19_4 [Harvfovirus sp.]|uniref:Uncharacterized protein n=1 Tax=Harvfovirus sp. TaxID=2487768 RepID=A0A3G5A6S7_9VIRU|nr:MAG: hypothetical protein Harvfovirus19_4 [Harvfovirus sp.]
MFDMKMNDDSIWSTMTTGEWITCRDLYAIYGEQVYEKLKIAIEENDVEKIDELFLNFPDRAKFEKILNKKRVVDIYVTAAHFERIIVLERLEKLMCWAYHSAEQSWDVLEKATENGSIVAVKYFLRKDIRVDHNEDHYKYLRLLDKCFFRSIEPNLWMPMFISNTFEDVYRERKQRKYAQYRKRTVVHKLLGGDDEMTVRMELFKCIYLHAKNVIVVEDLFQLAHGAIYFGFEELASYIFSLILLDIKKLKLIEQEITEFFLTALYNERWNIVSKLLKMSDNLDIVDELLPYAHEFRIKKVFCDHLLNQEKNILRCMKLERKMKLFNLDGFDKEKFCDRKNNVQKIMIEQFPEVLIDVIVDYC